MAMVYHLFFLWTIIPVTLGGEPNYEALFTGIADLGIHRFSGDLYWGSADGESRAYVFYGIKYASSKRFEPSWMNVDFSYITSPDRYKFGAQCMQFVNTGGNGASSGRATAGSSAAGHSHYHDYQQPSHLAPVMSEDCLFLDVYTPPVQRAQRQYSPQKKPVIVFVHGGFSVGNKLPGIGTEIARLFNTVFISVQYRLGIFGFLSTDDANAPGNYGLGDIKLALKWVRQWVADFGGDPDRITLMGHGSGSVLLSAAMLDPDVRAAVFGAIMMSGSVLNPAAVKPGRKDAETAAKILQCPTSSTTEMVLCLKVAKAQDMVAAVETGFPKAYRALGQEPFVITLDGHHLPYKPDWVMHSQPWFFRGGMLNGFSSEDSSLLLHAQWPDMFSPGKPSLDHVKTLYIPQILRIAVTCSALPANVIEAVYNRYGFGASADSAYLRKRLTALVNDIFWRAPAAKEAAIYAEKNLTQLGNQMYRFSFDDNIGDSAFGIHGLGTFHGLDLQYLFTAPGTPNLLGNKTNEGVTRQMRLMVTYLANYGNAFGDQFDPARGNFIQLGPEPTWIKTFDSGLNDLVQFWDKIAAVTCTAPQAVVVPAVHTSALTARTAITTRINPTLASWPTLHPGGGFPLSPNQIAANVIPQGRKGRRGINHVS